MAILESLALIYALKLAALVNIKIQPPKNVQVVLKDATNAHQPQSAYHVLLLQEYSTILRAIAV